MKTHESLLKHSLKIYPELEKNGRYWIITTWMTETQVFDWIRKNDPEIYMEVDGFYVYRPQNNSGYFTQSLLKAIADQLEMMNQDWEKQLNEDLTRLNQETNGFTPPEESDMIGC